MSKVLLLARKRIPKKPGEECWMTVCKLPCEPEGKQKDIIDVTMRTKGMIWKTTPVRVGVDVLESHDRPATTRPVGNQTAALSKVGYRLPFYECPNCQARQVFKPYGDKVAIVGWELWCYVCGWKRVSVAAVARVAKLKGVDVQQLLDRLDAGQTLEEVWCWLEGLQS